MDPHAVLPDVRTPSGFSFNMATWDRRTPCVEKVAPPAELQTTADRVLWEARRYGGYTFPMSSLRPEDQAKLAKELGRRARTAQDM
jgi:hypothetical protein